jgi:pyruvate kinase
MCKTKIICTLGPSSDNKETFKKLVENGLSVARLNLSHGDQDYIQKLIDIIKEVREEMNLPIAILMDTRGPEIRTKTFVDGKMTLFSGQEVTLCVGDFEGDSTRFCITYPILYQDVKPGNIILIDDGLIALEVLEVAGTDIICVVKNGGIVKNHKGINVPGVNVKLPAVTQRDEDDILFGIPRGIDFVAASFIRTKEDVQYIRNLLDANNGQHIQIVSKIESQSGVDHIDEIIDVSDAIMIARGDLGVETPPEAIPLIQKMIIRKCNQAEVPVITATQMLDSMIINPRPTRAEVSDVANAILDGTDVIMLSGETAAGAYPVEAVKTMREIAESVEPTIDHDTVYQRILDIKEKSVTNAVSHSTVSTAMYLNAAAILCPTYSGRTARMISMFRPKVPVVATTLNPVAQRQMSLLWGVIPLMMRQESSTDLLFYKSVELAKQAKIIKPGDIVVITAGVPLSTAGNTNLMKVQEVE